MPPCREQAAESQGVLKNNFLTPLFKLIEGREHMSVSSSAQTQSQYVLVWITIFEAEKQSGFFQPGTAEKYWGAGLYCLSAPACGS